MLGLGYLGMLIDFTLATRRAIKVVVEARVARFFREALVARFFRVLSVRFRLRLNLTFQCNSGDDENWLELLYKISYLDLV